MKPRCNLLRAALLPALIAALVFAQPAFALLSHKSGQPARLVLGQPNFTSSTSGTLRTRMDAPSAVAVDRHTHKVFVADSGNNRVLRFRSLYALRNGAAAEAVFGQPDYVSSSAATTQSGMYLPWGVFVDAGGRLWVADQGNNRVLRFDHASRKPSGANADGVLGQSGFNSSGHATTQEGMYIPDGVFVDGGGRLWVLEYANNRVLRFDHAASLPNGAPANGVLGQLDFTHGLGAVSQSGLNQPYNLTVDAHGRLWVADFGSSRVVRFDHAASLPNGANASAVLGQPDFTSFAGTAARNGMNFPEGVTVDNSTGRLYVADGNNNRILVFNSAARLANGANASFVLGQPGFASNGSGATARTLNIPSGVFFDPVANVLFVSEYNNSRVLMYGVPTPP